MISYVSCIFIRPNHPIHLHNLLESRDLLGGQSRREFHLKFNHQVPGLVFPIHPHLRNHLTVIGLNHTNIGLVVDRQGRTTQMYNIERKPTQGLLQCNRLLIDQVHSLPPEHRLIFDIDTNLDVPLDLVIDAVTTVTYHHEIAFGQPGRDGDLDGLTFNGTHTMVNHHPALNLHWNRRPPIALFQGDVHITNQGWRFL